MGELTRGGRWRRWWPFVVLLVAGGSRWLLVAVRPEVASTLGSEALGCAWAAMVAWSVRGGGERGGGGVWKSAAAGAMLLGGPMAALVVRGSQLDAIGMTIALALVPVVVGIAMAAMGEGSSEGISGRIWPGLAAVAGLLLILVQPALGDVRSDVGLVLAPVSTGVGAAMFFGQAGRGWPRVPLALAGAAGMFAVAVMEARFVEQVGVGVTLTAVACDGLMALLGVVALERAGAERWSAQFTLLPLVILMEGIVMVRPVVTTRWVVGLVLLAVASGFLLWPAEEDAGG